MANNGNIAIRMDIEGELKEQFLHLKYIKGLRHNVELIRHLIREAYLSLPDKKMDIPLEKMEVPVAA